MKNTSEFAPYPQLGRDQVLKQLADHSGDIMRVEPGVKMVRNMRVASTRTIREKFFDFFPADEAEHTTTSKSLGSGLFTNDRHPV